MNKLFLGGAILLMVVGGFGMYWWSPDTENRLIANNDEELLQKRPSPKPAPKPSPKPAPKPAPHPVPKPHAHPQPKPGAPRHNGHDVHGPVHNLGYYHYGHCYRHYCYSTIFVFEIRGWCAYFNCWVYWHPFELCWYRIYVSDGMAVPYDELTELHNEYVQIEEKP